MFRLFRRFDLRHFLKQQKLFRQQIFTIKTKTKLISSTEEDDTANQTAVIRKNNRF